MPIPMVCRSAKLTKAFPPASFSTSAAATASKKKVKGTREKLLAWWMNQPLAKAFQSVFH